MLFTKIDEYRLVSSERRLGSPLVCIADKILSNYCWFSLEFFGGDNNVSFE